MTDQTTDEPGRVLPFATMLNNIRGGQVSIEAAHGLQDLVTSVRDVGKKGTLVLQITVEPLKGGADDTLQVSGEVIVKAPKPTPKAAIFFADDEGNLLRDDPRQATIPDLRIAPSTTNNQPKDLAQ